MKPWPILLLACLLPLAAHAAGGAWRLTVDGDGAVLKGPAIGPEHAVTTLQCAGGEGDVEISTFLYHPPTSAHGEVGRLNLRSGQVVMSVPAEITPDDESGGAMLDGKAPASSTVMRAFARTGVLTLLAGDQRIIVVHATPARAARLLRVCRG